jgi:hypothetical protein
MQGLTAFSVCTGVGSIRWPHGMQQQSVGMQGRMCLRTLKEKTNALPRVGPHDPAPSYEGIDKQPLNRAIMALFRRKMAAAIGSDTDARG